MHAWRLRHVTGILSLVLVRLAHAQSASSPVSEERPGAAVRELPNLDAAPILASLIGKPVRRVQVVLEGSRWNSGRVPTIVRIQLGQPLDPELARHGIDELTERGEFASVRTEVRPWADGVELVFVALPRRLVARVDLKGGKLDAGEVLRIADVETDDEIVATSLDPIAERVRKHYGRHGFPDAKVRVEAIDTDDSLRVVLQIFVESGPPERIAARRFLVYPDPTLRELEGILSRYAVRENARAVEEQLMEADRALELRLRAAGWHRARITHQTRRTAAGLTLDVQVDAGPLLNLVFEGNHSFDSSQLQPALKLDDTEDRAPITLSNRIRDFYRRHGFLDAEVTVLERGEPRAGVHDLIFTVREREPVRVLAREYPCLTGPRSAAGVGAEIDSFLSEELPGTGLLGAVDPHAVDVLYGPQQTTGARVAPHSFNPWKTYVPEVYERAIKHLQELYRSEGYLSAEAGPAHLMRRTCHPHSPVGTCRPLGPPPRPLISCNYDAHTWEPAPEAPVDPRLNCQPNAAKGIRCEPNATLVIPIKLGPQTVLYDLSFEGNQHLVEQQLLREAALPLGKPVSLPEIEKARRRLLDLYAEEGYPFANIESDLEFSPDRSRARARFVIGESEQVLVSGVVIRGARTTNERLIRRRVVLETGAPFRRSLARRTEQRLGFLGVFSNVTVELDQPEIPAKEKLVVITVREEVAQYIEATGGLSSGEGLRGTLSYGYRNLGGQAIQLRTRFHLSYLPSFFIVEPDVRDRFERLSLSDRLERNNTIALEFPEIGLGPLFRLSVEGLDVRDNSRDFGLSRDAGLVTLMFRPTRRLSAQIGPSIENNYADIFGANEEAGALARYVGDNPSRANLFRVPQGRTWAFAQQLSATWDRRDNPLNATRGTLVSARIEHVRAVPENQVGSLFSFGVPGSQASVAASSRSTVFNAVVSQFLRITGRVAAYLPLRPNGLSLGLSLAAGANIQLIRGSQTYPDRLFFLGGADSLRGFFQASLIPEDIAQEILVPGSGVTIKEVVIRGGDLFINPRTELRIPIGKGQFQTAVFIDSGNIWADATRLQFLQVLNPANLRYAAGLGLRVATPVGPLVFDYGFNADRVLDELFPTRTRQRTWEDLGAFHFSIGLF